MVAEPDNRSAPEVRFAGRAASTAIGWSAIAVIGRQAFQLTFGIVLARLLGPQLFGVVGLATIFITLTVLLLDQGLSSALIQRQRLSPGTPGAAATLNLMSGALLGAATQVAAPVIAAFFHSPGLVPVLRLLGVGLLVKALAVAPRALLGRRLQFRALAVADLAGASIGAAAGILCAVLGAGYYSVVVQTIVLDLVVAVILLRAAHGPRPNMQFRELATILPFGARIFATNCIAYMSRNFDNILVGRYLGISQLAFYGMAYRVLVIPVQLLGQTVNRVLFPFLSRVAGDRARVAETLLWSTQLLAYLAVPSMVLLACSAHEIVLLALGRRWLPSAPLISVLALAGARETVFYVTPSLMKALNHASLNLIYEIGATTVQLTGIVVGLQFGLLGVAIGYALAGLCLTPVLMLIQRQLTGVTLGRQVAVLVPALHAASWASGAYLLCARLRLEPLITFGIGCAAYLATLGLVLYVCHRSSTVVTYHRLTSLRTGSTT